MARSVSSPQLPPARTSIPPFGSSTDGKNGPIRRLRTACDYCHQAKVRCSGGTRCVRCQRDNVDCYRSYTAKMGKPKGSKVKKTTHITNNGFQRQIIPDRRSNSTWTIEETPDPSMCSKEVPAPTIEEEPLPPLTWLPAPSPDDLHPIHSHTQDGFGNSALETGTMCFSAGTSTFPSVLDFEIPSSDAGECPSIIDQQSPARPEHGRSFSIDVAQLGSIAHHTLPPERRFSEDFDESARYNSFNSIGLDCFGMPLSPPESASEYEADHLGPEMHGNGLFTPLQHRHSSVKAACLCLQNQASQLSQLHAVEQQESSMKLDTVLHYTSATMRTAERVLRCGECKSDCQVLLTTIMVIQTVFRWAESIFGTDGLPYSQLELTMGRYALSNSEMSLVGDMLCSRIFGRSQQVLDLLHQRVEQAQQHAYSTPPSQTVEIEYLRHSCQSLFQTLLGITKHLHGAESGGVSCLSNSP